MKKKPATKKKPVSAKSRPFKKPTGKLSPKAKVASRSASLMLVYGFGDDHEPRAAFFTEPDFKLAKKAAGLLQLQVLIDSAPKLLPALKGIKAGNAHAPGSGFASEIGHERFDALLAALDLLVPPRPSTAPRLPVSFDAIEVGSFVTAQADDPSQGWWPTVVEAVEGDMLTLRSIDAPDVVVRRHRCAVALRYTPDYMPPESLAEAAPGLPKGWESLKADHLVIARQSRADGAYEALVTKVEGSKRVTMRWRDAPKLPAFTRTFAELSLLYPLAPEPKPAADEESAA